MQKTRKIIEIDEEKCTGCGQCILACAEGALALVDGKARLVGEIYCDGIGACIGDCPEGALKVVEREAEAFDAQAVARRLGSKAPDGGAAAGDVLPCGCPSAAAMVIEKREPAEDGDEVVSRLGHWPIKLQLLAPTAAFLAGSDFVLLADCAGVAWPNLHQRLLGGRAVAMGCPKLDDLGAHIDRLAAIFKKAVPRSVTVVRMEVPCCRAFVDAAQKALDLAGVSIPLREIVIGRDGVPLGGD